MSRPRVAVFRPDDERLAEAVELLSGFGAEVVDDPMLAVERTGAVAREDAEFVVLTSSTGVGVLAEAEWDPDGAVVCAIGPRTARACNEVGFRVDIVPETYSSQGLVDALRDQVSGVRIEVARSAHGSDVLLNGLIDAGGYVHESVLYHLVRPPSSGQSVEMAAAGDLDAVLFTSSLTVTNFLDAAAARCVRSQAIQGIRDSVVGVIGEPTRVTAAEQGIQVDVVPDEATFESLARAVMDRLDGET